MDASAYLVKQGWRGSGHSLDQTNRGIARPLLISKKVDVLGVGLNKHAAVSDQWWLRAYDQGLQALGTGKESALAQVQKHGVNRGGLYGRFVRGEGVAGTLGDKAAESTTQTTVVSPTFEGKLATIAGQADFKSIATSGAAPAPATGAKRKREAKDEGNGVAVKKEKQGNGKKKEVIDSVALKENMEQRAAKKLRSRERKKAEEDGRANKLQERKKGGKEKVRKTEKRRKLASELQATQREEKAITAKLLAEDAKKLIKYEERAAEKGVTLLDYYKRRQEKFAEKMGLPLKTAETLAPAPSPTTGGFVIDTVGSDPSATPAVPAQDGFPCGPDGKVPMDPALWEGKVVKDLPRPIRDARKRWIAVHRAERKVATGKAGKKKANRGA